MLNRLGKSHTKDQVRCHGVASVFMGTVMGKPLKSKERKHDKKNVITLTFQLSTKQKSLQ